MICGIGCVILIKYDVFQCEPMHGIFSRTVRLSRTQGAMAPPSTGGSGIPLGPPSMATPSATPRKKHSCTPQKDGTPSPTGSTCSLVRVWQL